jgi:hypothetical protein
MHYVSLGTRNGMFLPKFSRNTPAIIATAPHAQVGVMGSLNSNQLNSAEKQKLLQKFVTVTHRAEYFESKARAIKRTMSAFEHPNMARKITRIAPDIF